jgi:hypothetical protein
MLIARILNLRDNLIGDPGIKAGERLWVSICVQNWLHKLGVKSNIFSCFFFEFAGDLMLLEKQ